MLKTIKGLRDLAASIEWSQDPLTLQAYSQDLWPRKLLKLREEGPEKTPAVDLVLWPENTEEVSQIVQWAHHSDVALYPYGAGSGVCGASIPEEFENRIRVLIDLKRMRRMRALDRESGCVWAEAGWIGENLERTLNQEGYTLGHFPSSIYCSSLGGYLATRSAGQLSTKYGKIEDLVLALEVVLPDGSVAVTGRAPRSAMGPDWTQLFLGSEGTLGVLTAACLQVHVLPEERVFLSFGAQELAQALKFARAILQDGLRPAVLRIYDPLETSLTLSSQILKDSSFAGEVALVLIFEGKKNLTATEAAEALQMGESFGLQNLGQSLAKHWWAHRYDVSYKQQLILSHKRMMLDTFEVATTWDKILEVYRAVKGVSVGLGVVMAHFSHFYHTGANIYFTLVSHSGVSGSTLNRYDEIWSQFLAAAHGSGATLSHHHGVGLQKKGWIEKEAGAFHSIFKKVKNAFDPENRFNPGKMGF